MTGCKNSSGTIDQIPSSSISFTEIRLDSIIGQPISAHFLNTDSLLINDAKGNYLLNAFNIESGKLVFSSGAIGNGPNELLPPIRVTNSKDSVYILSLSSKKVYNMPISHSTLNEITQLPIEVMGLYFLQNYEIFIAPVMSFSNQDDSKSVYAYVYDKNFSKIQDIEDYATPWSGEVNYDKSAISRFHQIQGVSVTEDGTIGILEQYLLRLYTYKDGKVRSKSDIQLFPYEYDFTPSGKGSMLPKTDLRKGFISGARDMVSFANTFLISVDKSVKGGQAETQSVNTQLVLLNSKGERVAEYVPTVDLKPYPITVSDNGLLVMFSEKDELAPFLSQYPKKI